MDINNLKEFYLRLYVKTLNKDNWYFYCLGHLTGISMYSSLSQDQIVELKSFIKIVRIERMKG